MAKKKAAKKTNIRKKLDLNKYNPQALIQRGLSTAALRRLYSDFRSVAKKRIAALKQKGYGNTDEVTRAYFPTLKEVDTKPDPMYYLRAKIFELAKYLNNPLTLIRNQANRMELKSIQTLREHGHEIAASNYESFGKFMQALKSRVQGLLVDSERAVQFYESNKDKLSAKELVSAFSDWEAKELKTIVENAKLLYPDDYSEYLKERGIDYNAYKRGEYTQQRIIPPTSGSLSGENTKRKKKGRRK